MHSRRPLPALALVLPHPPLPTCASLSHLSGVLSPRTPRACSPSTPVLLPTQLVASPRTSIDSWGSSNGAGDDEVQWEWKSEQMSLLISTLDTLPGHLFTPFNGPVPPSNLLDKIARSVSQSQGPLEWPHSVRATRAKLAEIARARDKGRSKENMTIDEREEDKVMEASSRQPNSKRPLYRQSSMDFLPTKNKVNGSLSRLSSRLQRTDRVIATYHPYPRPASRSPSPSTLARRSEPFTQAHLPKTPIFSSFLSPLRSRTSSTSLGSCPQPLRRSVSAMSTQSNPVPSSTLSDPPNAGTLASVKPGDVRRSDSFSSSLPTGPSLKRAPSFGATSLASARAVSKHVPEEKQAQDPESDDEEKAREKTVKRPRMRPTTTALSSDPEKKRKNREKKAQTQKGVGVVLASSTKSKSRPKTTRSESMFGAELPKPQKQCTLPSVVAPRSASASPPPGSPVPTPKTLRRVKTTNFNLGSCPPARRISFGSLLSSVEEPERDNAPTTGLGSAFQLS